MKASNIWKKIRVRYCILKSLVSGPKSEQELLDQIIIFPEFLRIKKNTWENNELAFMIKDSITELKSELKIKERDILNTRTWERRIEWFLNQEWISRKNLFKSERERVRILEEITIKARIEEERIQQEKIERESREQVERVNKEKTLQTKRDQKITSASKPINQNLKDSNSSSVVNGILAIVAVGGGLYVVGKIGDALNRAITFPVFLIACAAGYSIYYLTKDKKK